MAVLGQKVKINGVVTSSKSHDPLSGVTISSVSSGKSVGMSDSLGKFKISINNTDSILKFYHVGYASFVLDIKKAKSFNIQLADSSSNLDEVVVVNIGYGTVRKEAITGAVSSISSKDLADFPVGNVADALAGKLAGVSVQRSEGSPGADFTIRVRGGSSLTGDNAPLYIVDGVQMENALSILSPSEIAKIDVLKDVASTSIYGSRGANGVIIITTKSGRNGKTNISVDAFTGVRKIVNELEVMDPYDFVMYQYELANNNTTQDTKNTFTNKYGTWDDLDIYKNIAKKNWQQDVFGRSALSNSETMSLNGGNNTTTYNFSLGNYNEQGIMLNSAYKRIFGTFRFDHKLSKTVKIGVNARYSRQRIDGSGTSSSGSQGTNRLRNAVRFQPYDDGTEATGDVLNSDYLTTGLTNPVLLANNELKYDYRNDLITSGYFNWQILPGLTFNTNFGMTFIDRTINAFSGQYTYLARNNSNLPVIDITTANTIRYINTNTLTYSPVLKNEHSLNILLGQETNRIDVKNYDAVTKWFPASTTAAQAFAGVQQATPPTGSVQDAPTSSVSGMRQLSYFARINYSYKSKYLATANIRRDGSSFFSPSNRWAIFPSIQLAWRTSQEKFFEDLHLPWMQNFKVRFSYGAAGNNQIGSDLWRNLYASSGTSGGYAATDASISPSYIPNSVMPNPNIKWETNYSANLGFDMDLFKKLSVSIDLYNNKTKDLLLLANIPPTNGYTTQQQNVGKTQNKGLEIQINYRAINTANFTYTASFNISFYQNKILELQRGVNSYITQSGWVNSLGDFLVEVGKPVGQFYGYVSDGRYTVDDFNYSQNADGSYTYTLKDNVPNSYALLGNRQPQPGSMKVKKMSSGSSMIIGDSDRVVLGNAQPKFFGGLNNQFRYKNFDASIFVNFSVGNKEYNANKIEFTSQYNVTDNNLLSVMSNRWINFDQNGNKITDPQTLTSINANTKMWTPTVGNYSLYSYAIEDASFLRITNVTLGYSLPTNLVNKTGFISRMRVYATVNNLHTFTKYTGYDPEASTRRSNPLTPGVDYAAYPRSRNIVAGLNVYF